MIIKDMKINSKDAYYAWIKKDGKRIFVFCTKDMEAVKIDLYEVKIPLEFIEQPFEFERWGTGFDL